MSDLTTGHETLDQLATRINLVATQVGDLRLQLGRMLGEAAERVPRELGIPFKEWAVRNLRRRDGKPYAIGSLYNLIWQGRDPANIERHREQNRQTLHRKLTLARGDVSLLAIDEQVAHLELVWRTATPPARAKFLARIGVVYREPVTLDAEEFATSEAGNSVAS